MSDDLTAEEIREALGHMAETAMREPGVVRKSEMLDDPTRWDEQHGRINDWLDDLERAKVQA